MCCPCLQRKAGSAHVCGQEAVVIPALRERQTAIRPQAHSLCGVVLCLCRLELLVGAVPRKNRLVRVGVVEEEGQIVIALRAVNEGFEGCQRLVGAGCAKRPGEEVVEKVLSGAEGNGGSGPGSPQETQARTHIGPVDASQCVPALGPRLLDGSGGDGLEIKRDE